MTAYELMIKTNHYLIKGGTLTDIQKQNIIGQFLATRSTPEQARRFYIGVKYPGNTDSSGRQMYPMFFIPPYKNESDNSLGKKYKTIFNQMPKTHILSANMYELEILRLLRLLGNRREQAPALQGEIDGMVEMALARLKTTCFGYMDDGLGECFDTSLVVLRFLAAVAPHETEWIQSRIDNYNRHYDDKKRPWFLKWYYWLCLSELPFEFVKPEIEKYKSEMLDWLTNKSCIMNSEHDKTIHPVLLCMLRNIIAKYPEYAYIKDRQPYLDDNDGRLYFDMSKVNKK